MAVAGFNIKIYEFVKLSSFILFINVLPNEKKNLHGMLSLWGADFNDGNEFSFWEVLCCWVIGLCFFKQ